MNFKSLNQSRNTHTAKKRDKLCLYALVSLLLMVVLFSCEKEEEKDATINYFISSISDDTTFREVAFQFDYTRAHRNQNSQIRTVYLAPKRVNIDLNDPVEIFLGSSTIEPQIISGYDFGFSDFKVITLKDTIDLIQPYNYDDYVEFSFKPVEGSDLNIFFVLDIDKSTIILDSIGQNWIKPQILVENE